MGGAGINVEEIIQAEYDGMCKGTEALANMVCFRKTASSSNIQGLWGGAVEGESAELVGAGL